MQKYVFFFLRTYKFSSHTLGLYSYRTGRENASNVIALYLVNRSKNVCYVRIFHLGFRRVRRWIPRVWFSHAARASAYEIRRQFQNNPYVLRVRVVVRLKNTLMSHTTATTDRRDGEKCWEYISRIAERVASIRRVKHRVGGREDSRRVPVKQKLSYDAPVNRRQTSLL